MPRKPSQQQVFTDLQDRYGPEIAKAFLAAVDDLKSAADVQRVIAALQAGDIEAAIQALHLDRAAYSPLLDAIQTTYTAGGQAGVSTLPAIADAAGAAVVIRFDGRNLRAEQWLREHSSDLVTRILDDQRQAVRQALEGGMRAGVNPRTTALDIVGRLDRATNKRVGGILGLSLPQEGYVTSARAELASTDPAALKNYLARARRDRRFDRTILKALRDETPVPADIQRKAVEAYQNRLLALRGETIGKHEAFNALAESKHEAYLQAVESGGVRPQDVRKTWRHFDNAHPRPQHVAMDGQSVGLNEPFQLPDGTLMRYPHDPSAPISQTAGCYCQGDYRIDFLSNLT